MYEQQPKPEVVVTDIKMGFGSMVLFMVKWAFAAIPALFLTVCITFAILIGLSVTASVLGLSITVLGLNLGGEASNTTQNKAVSPPAPSPTAHVVKALLPQPTPTPEVRCYENGVKIPCPDATPASPQ